MSVFDQKNINQEHIKLRWREPYVSHALNRGKFGNQPKGVYAGFNIEPTGYRTYEVNGLENPVPFQGSPVDHNKGAYDSTSGYSIAIFEDTLGHNTTVAIPPMGVSGVFDIDLSGSNEEQKIIALNVDYAISNETQGQVLAVDAAEIAAHPEYIVLGVINTPADGVSATDTDIDYEDIEYPRTTPFATPRRYGYMSPQQATALAGIGNEADSLFCSNDDAEVLWRIFDVSGADIGRLDIYGNLFYNQPTDSFNVQVSTSGTTVSGISDDDVVYFTFPLDGSVTGIVPLEIAPNNLLPEPEPEHQLVVFGMRCNNDWWFKNGMKWEVGELKPYGVTSKFPNLTVGEVGNDPSAENVSGIFFANATVDVQTGGKDVHVLVNVSGPPEAIEEEQLVTGAFQNDFTTQDPGMFWTFADDKYEPKIFQNGILLTQWDSSTSGVTFSDGTTPIWEWVKTGTRSIHLRKPALKDAVITFRLEPSRGIDAFEETHLVTATSGVSIINSIRPFTLDNDIHDITVFRNGIKRQYENTIDPKIHDVQKTGTQELTFLSPLPQDSVITIRHESTIFNQANVSGGGGSGDFWFTPIDAHLNPDTDGVWDIGNTGRMRNANFSGDGSFGGDFHIGGKLNVSGGIDPLYMQFNEYTAGLVPTNSIFVDESTKDLVFKDEFGTDHPLISVVSGINIDEDEVMTNPYPFAISAPKAVSVSGNGNFFVLTDFQNPEHVDNFFGILTQNVSAFGDPMDGGVIKWRGKLPLSGFSNGAVFVSGLGELVEDAPDVSGQGILETGIVKNNTMFIRPTKGFIL